MTTTKSLLTSKELLDQEYRTVKYTEDWLRAYRKYLFYRRHKWMKYIPFGAFREMHAYYIWSQMFGPAETNMKLIAALRKVNKHPDMKNLLKKAA